MTLLKCATHTVTSVDDAIARFSDWMDYAVVESGALPVDLARSWSAPASAGRDYAVMQPASGEAVFLRFVEGDPVPAYRPIHSLGWAAIELCVTDVDAVHERMKASPFDVIGEPHLLGGFNTVKPMQVRGPDQETVYLTEILVDGPTRGLPSPRSLIDRPFIQVLACPDMRATIAWFKDVVGLEVIDPVPIRYGMISQSFGLPPDTIHEIVTCKWKGEVFLELDQYPAAAPPRPTHPGALPPGVSLTTMIHPEFARLDGHWASEPAPRDGAIYQGRLTGVLKTPEGALLEVIDGSPN